MTFAVQMTDVYVLKRPFVDQFLVRPRRHECPGLSCSRVGWVQADVGTRFEVVVFTASLAKYADPLIDLLDVGRVVRWRLFREACYPYEGNYVKDLTCLGRDLRSTIIVDNSPHSYIFQPFNAIPVRNFIDDQTERDLLELLTPDGPLRRLERAEDVTSVLGDLYLPGCYAHALP
jgi:RNA polymerase II subunit A small phosphatase-like protein